MSTLGTSLVWAFLAVSPAPAPGAPLTSEWPQFRGPDGTGYSADTDLPLRWSATDNVHWKVDLPGRGLSCPVVAGGRVYLTACSGYKQRRLHVLCWDAGTGQLLWERQFAATGNTVCHPKTSMAAPTPVTDGEHVYALFATGDLACLDAEGNLLWYRALVRDYPHVTNQVGLAASPVLWQDVLVVPLENAEDSFAAGLDKRTGQNRWKVPRPRDITWTTPLLVTGAGRTELLFASAQDLTAYDPATGRRHWTYTGGGTASIPSPVAGAGLIILGGGAAVRPGSGPTAPAVAWSSAKLRPAYATPLYYRGRLYAVNNAANLLNCFDPKTGQVLWQERLRGPFSASPVAGDGKVYLVNEEGLTTVFEAGDRPRILATNRLGEEILATPALAGGRIFLRSDKHLYCIGEQKKR